MYIDHTVVKTSDPFTYRQEEISCLIKSLESELVEFKSSLQNTEDLVNDVQVDMDDFRNRMETYIKDIPESHYSAVSVNVGYGRIMCSSNRYKKKIAQEIRS